MTCHRDRGGLDEDCWWMGLYSGGLSWGRSGYDMVARHAGRRMDEEGESNGIEVRLRGTTCCCEACMMGCDALLWKRYLQVYE